ncbi:glycosyl transferase [Clostridium zeae]|uniref:Glycosyl transferase n=1 Tax=Clostridium zeae TaxID=2759022 RepID=A0ABQ1ECZ5_9CLOT|nr:nucleotide disphospho-sugar-binding domain-containing protein [Clostridium zeae]GFZ32678.1 glycosyl transferase [Clostridium zeae]
MKIVVMTYPNYSHNTSIATLLNELVNQGNEVFCFGKSTFKSIYSYIDMEFIEYPSNIGSRFGNITEAYINDKDKPSNDNLIENLIYKGIFNTDFALKVCTDYRDSIIDIVKAINPDLILRDSCALFGKMIGEKLGIDVIGYITNLAISKEYIFNDLQKNLSDAFCLDLSSYDDDTLKHLYLSLENGIKQLCDKYDISSIPTFFTLDPHENFNIIFSSKLLQPKIENNNNLIYKVVSPSLFSTKNKNIKPDSHTNCKKKLIYVSTGSIFSADIKFYNTIISSFKDSDYDVIISFPLADNKAISFTLPDNVKVEKFVDQKKILSEASLFITHGGYNSIYESIYYEVPMMVYPLTNDQHLNATIIDNLNIGVDLRKHKFNSSNVKHLADYMINHKEILSRIASIKEDFTDSISQKEIVQYITNRNYKTR